MVVDCNIEMFESIISVHAGAGCPLSGVKHGTLIVDSSEQKPGRHKWKTVKEIN